jgi:hypothetical protein
MAQDTDPAPVVPPVDPPASAGLPISLSYVFTAKLLVQRPLSVGQTSYGDRKIINIIGGSFAGPDIRGEVLSGGANYQISTPDGTAMLEARFTCQTDDGVLIYVSDLGIRTGPPEVLARLAKGEVVDAAEYYFRTTPRFEVSSEKYRWLSHSMFVSTAKRELTGVTLDVYKIA